MRVVHVPLILLFTAFIGLTGCEPSDQKKLRELKHNVEALHDTLMKKNEELVKLRRKLAKSMNGSASQEERMKIREHVGLINAGESFMADWMKMYKEPDENEPIADVIEYYSSQLKELERMDTQFEDAEKKAKAFINRYGE